jgi:hypothetical protein
MAVPFRSEDWIDALERLAGQARLEAFRAEDPLEVRRHVRRAKAYEARLADIRKLDSERGSCV